MEKLFKIVNRRNDLFDDEFGEYELKNWKADFKEHGATMAVQQKLLRLAFLKNEGFVLVVLPGAGWRLGEQ